MLPGEYQMLFRNPVRLHRFVWVAATWIAGVCATVLLSDVCLAQNSATPQKESQEIDRHVASLANDSYRVRQNAKQSLWSLSQDSRSLSTVVVALDEATRSLDLEQRETAVRLLQDIRLAEVEKQLARLVDPATNANEIELPFWNRYRQTAGDDQPARFLFAKIARQYFPVMEWLERSEQVNASRSQGRWAVRDLTLQNTAQAKANTSKLARLAHLGHLFDPYSIAADDAALWALLLCTDQPERKLGLAGLSTRVTLALTRTGGGPVIVDQSESRVIKRIIGQWVARDHGTGLDRERLLIALKHDCVPQAAELCHHVLQDRFAAPSAHAMALLSASVLERPELEQILLAWTGDERTAHVWQLIASRKTTIRTQVSDVAVALLLHHRGIDPREVGFEELQADPLTVFREHSLGFADPASRKSAYQKAQALVGNVLESSSSSSVSSVD